jgi:mRNA interferase YafQ
MLQPIYKKKFEKDLKRVAKRGNNLNKLRTIINNLIHEKPLDKKFLDHPLKGEYADCRECHIEPDWLLIYLIDGDYITFVRTGTHSDLFG